MTDSESTVDVSPIDVVVVGAGPVGLACAIAAIRQGLSARVIEKGALVDSLIGYPTQMELFSTPELIEIGGHPFACQGYKPTREEAIDYYRGVARVEALDLRLYERVERIDGEAGAFEVVTTRRDGEPGRHLCRAVIVAVGFFDVPNRLGLDGEDEPRVTHYYKEPYAYTGQQVAVVGAKNSAAKAALDCYRNGADVTLIHRGDGLSDRVKYWIRPDLENRIAEGSIRAFFGTTITGIEPGALRLATPDGEQVIANDFVLAMTGYRPDYDLLATFGIATHDDAARTPVYDATTFETNRSGVYLAGTVCGGLHTGRWFIENGRHHAEQIAHHVAHGAAPEVDLVGRHWKTAE
ncbi:MAG: YpdA family putative bacillithiol disulfide reductase [Acidobacteriota bacterium]